MTTIYPKNPTLEARFDALGITVADLSRASGLAAFTIKRVFEQCPNVRQPTVTHLRVTLDDLEQKQRSNRQEPL